MKQTFQKPHSSVKALRTKFIITKGTEQLADEYIGQLRHLDKPHVTKQNLDPVTIPLFLLSRL